MISNRYPRNLWDSAANAQVKPTDQDRVGSASLLDAVLQPALVANRQRQEAQSGRTAAVSTQKAEGVFTVDVEDWFHILDVGGPQIDEWDTLPSRVERNFARLLDLLSEKKVSATCFFLGWVAKRFPNLVKEAVLRGHEIASHGYAHRLTYELTREQFYDDVLRARLILEEITGGAVNGYRSPGFSMAEWIFDAIAEAGYKYDSSIFPAPHGNGGMPNAPRAFHSIPCRNGQMLLEFPITVANVLSKPVCVSGGGYMRLFPYWLIRLKSRQVINEGRPVVFYIHPREIDPKHPRLPMSAYRRFKSYVNIDTTETKISHILEDFRVTTFQEYLNSK